MTDTKPTAEVSVKKWFEANYLDGDEVQDGQMLSSAECLEALHSHTTALKGREFEEKIICSAVKFKDKVWMGHRHGGAINAMHDALSYTMNRKEMNEAQVDRNQGFVTSTGRYVDRAEAWVIAENAGQILKREYQTKDCLYSEDVW